MGSITKRIMALPYPRRELWDTISEFMAFLDPRVEWRGKTFDFAVGEIPAVPLRCGADLRADADVVFDNACHHWISYYRNWGQTAVNSGVQFLNSGQTYRRLDKHNCYDVLTRCMHPADRHPVTVLLPEFRPYTTDQSAQQLWEAEQRVRTENTRYGFDPERASVDAGAVLGGIERFRSYRERLVEMQREFYPRHNYLQATVNDCFGGKFPLYLKPAKGFMGEGVSRVRNLEELYARFDETRGAFHLQEAIEDYDVHTRCVAVGPQVLLTEYLPERPHHEHYAEDLLDVPAEVRGRLRDYVLIVDAYHQWSHNSLEAIIKDGRIHPIDYANAAGDSALTSLHVHYFWLVCAFVRWCTYVAVEELPLGPDLEQSAYASVFHSTSLSQAEKFTACARIAHRYFSVERFAEYCRRNMASLEDAMVRFYDAHADRIVSREIRRSRFPRSDHDAYILHYREKLERSFRPNAVALLRAGVTS